MENKIPGRNEWVNLSIPQLYEVKSQLTTLYYNMRGAGASHANQYLSLINQISVLISEREIQEQMESQTN